MDEPPEAILRLATVAHVTWLCDVQARTWRCLSDALVGAGPIGTDATRAEVFPDGVQYMTYGGKALHGLKDKASSYLAARLGINALLWSLSDLNIPYQGTSRRARVSQAYAATFVKTGRHW